MLNQKDNDFDDLFRRASDRYPLRTDSADWDRMAGALDNPSSTELTDEGVSEDKRRRRRFLWLFLLLPLGGAGYYFLHSAGHGAGGHSGVGGNGSVVERTVTPGKGETGGGSGETGGVDASAGTSGVDAQGGTSGKTGTNAGGGTSGVASGKEGTNAAGVNSEVGGKGVVAGGVSLGTGGKGVVAGGGTSGVATGKKGVTGGDGVNRGVTGNVNGGGGVTASTGVGGKGRVRSATEGRMTDMDDVVVNGKRKKNIKPGGNGIDGGGGDNDNNFDAVANITGGGSAGAGAGRVAGYPVNRVGMRQDYRLNVNVEAPVVTKDSSIAKAKASNKKKSSFLYAGLMAAPDLSTVKFQSTNGVGTTFSLLLGYQFNKKWAVETGVSLDRKKYYTTAEYVDTKNLHIPLGGELKDMGGTCYMWEIPINVRYNFSQSEKTSWFATAGLSTYFMTRESYYYDYIAWSGPSSWPNSGNWNIKKPSNYWFSIINLSAGYEHRIGKIGNLRIEPYIRIPTSGLGTGKLNILSSGLNVGITRRLW